MADPKPLRIGYVPEHFSTPVHFAQKHFGLTAQLIPFPSGTGHMITSLRAGEIDVGIGLTEGWIAGLGKEDVVDGGGYGIVGTYVETPLCKSLLWASLFALFWIGSGREVKRHWLMIFGMQAGRYPPGPPVPSPQSSTSNPPKSAYHALGPVAT